jgi:RNA polymerase sigma-70 factor (ECF subfamily)
MDERDEDDLLAHRSRQGDGVALGRLYRRYAPALLRYLERCTGERAEAEDILQETFVRLFEGRGSYEGRGRFRSWLFTVATRLVVDRARRARRHAELLESALAPWSTAPAEPMDAFFTAGTQQRIDAALADLPPEYALAFHLRVQEGFAYAEIAAMCGDPAGTLRSRVHHAVRRLRAALAAPETHSPHASGADPEPGPEPCHDGGAR